ncbi:adenosylcobinamide amidohydrolase, partial [uncultured Paracoccus sp.]|uniref:adenosylcobinamide amidohydrolase n=1 Tax=uncultured Paracoccus sp. TaxID=189685 RepID=UPI0025D111EE
SRGLGHACVAVAGPVTCVATVGLGNAERVGHRRGQQEGQRQGYGTINIALLIDAGLTDAALIEALSIAAQARTLAVLEAGVILPSGPATGTGTDCIAVACDPGGLAHAGLHTALGEAIGRAVCDAVGQGASDWKAAQG